MKILEANGITVKYGNHVALKDVSFLIEEKDYLCIVGCNGSGKSTLIKAMLGLVSVDNGNINLSINRKDIGYIPQQTAIQKDFPATVYEIVLSGCNSGLFKSNQDKQLAIENLNKLGIYDLKDVIYRNLSGGQQQRVLLARALCSTQKILIMDEPITGLDPNTTKEFYELTHRLNEEGITIVTTSHDIDEVTKYATKVLELETIVTFFGSTKEYFEVNKHTHEYGVTTC